MCCAEPGALDSTSTHATSAPGLDRSCQPNALLLAPLCCLRIALHLTLDAPRPAVTSCRQPHLRAAAASLAHKHSWEYPEAPDCSCDSDMGDASNEPTSKRAKTDVQALNEALFSQQSMQTLTDTFKAAQPYTHVVIRELCNQEVLASAREELIHNVEARYKETDLFKVCCLSCPRQCQSCSLRYARLCSVTGAAAYAL